MTVAQSGKVLSCSFFLIWWIKLHLSPKRQWHSSKNVPHSFVLYLELRLLFFFNSWDPWANLQFFWYGQYPNYIYFRQSSDFSLLRKLFFGVFSGEYDSQVETEQPYCLQPVACSPFYLNILLPNILFQQIIYL